MNVALEGRRRVERQLGESGMATVYVADDRTPTRVVMVGNFLAEVGERLETAR